MIGYSETDLIMRDAMRDFIAREIAPVSDEIESGKRPPYDLMRKLFAEFGVDVMATDGVKAMLKAERKRAERKAEAAENAGVEGAEGDSDQSTDSVAAKKDKKDKHKHKARQEAMAKQLKGIAGQAPMAVAAMSELAGSNLGMVVSAAVSIGLGAGTIASRGTLEQKERWLPELLTMEKVAAWAITEPDAGSDAFGGMSTYVRRDGEDYILNGQKTFITNGPYADVAVVYAKLDEGDDSVSKRDRKVLTFVLDKGMEGFTQSEPFKKMGIGSSPTGAFYFDNVRLSKDRLLGGTENHKSGDGRDSARLNFVIERVSCAVAALGLIERCQRTCVKYSKERSLWGQEIGRFQLVQMKLADMEIARLNVRNMLFQVIAGAKEGKVPNLGEASAIKYYSTKVACEVTMEAVQLLGGNGYMAEYEVERLARDAKSLTIFAGSNEIQVTHIAKDLLAGGK